MKAGTFPFEAYNVSKSFAGDSALVNVTTRFPRGSVIGLIGRNGSGKSTLLHHVTGLVLPTVGDCVTLGEVSHRLGAEQLERIGVVTQPTRLLDWMSVTQHLDYVASFYPRWDAVREKRLIEAFDLPTSRPIAKLSPGDEQKVAIVTAVCHHPELLLLDEPVSALDPIAREAFLEFVLEVVRDDGATIVISSHAMRDVERIVDHVLCLDDGRVAYDGPLDELLESYAEWVVTASAEDDLPQEYRESWIVSQRLEGRRGVLIVRDADVSSDDFEARYDVRVERRPLNLERIFPYLVRKAVRS